MIAEATSRKICNMSLLCAALVVMRHIGLTGDMGSLAWFVQQFIVNGFALIAVPFSLWCRASSWRRILTNRDGMGVNAGRGFRPC